MLRGASAEALTALADQVRSVRTLAATEVLGEELFSVAVAAAVRAGAAPGRHRRLAPGRGQAGPGRRARAARSASTLGLVTDAVGAGGPRSATCPTPSSASA